MDEANLEKYIREKSNGKNIIKIRIIESLLGLEFASRTRLWKDTFVYVRKNFRWLGRSFPDPTLSSNEIILRDKFESSLSALIRDGVVTEREGRNELMIGLDSPLVDYDDDHTLYKLCWRELDIEPKSRVPLHERDGEPSKKRQDDLESFKKALRIRWDNHITALEKQQRDEVSAEDGDTSVPKWKARTSLMDSIEPIINAEPNEEKKERMWRQIANDMILQTELDLKKFVEDVLRSYGEWWRPRAPDDVRKKVQERMEGKKEDRQRSGEYDDLRKLDPITRLLNDADLGQIIKIIDFTINSKDFEEAFGDKGLKQTMPFLTLLLYWRNRGDIAHPDLIKSWNKDRVQQVDVVCRFLGKQMEAYFNRTASR